MAKSRLNPNKESRRTLTELQGKGVLDRQKVGLRHIIKPDGTVQPVGFDVGFPWNKSDLPNFYPGSHRADMAVQYNGERAELTATLGRAGYKGHVLDVSSHFPPNPLATDLIVATHQDPRFGGYWRNCEAYGDAVLVTDNRMHWVFKPFNVAGDEVRDFDVMLTTPRTLFDHGNRPWIFFHEEPNQQDIVMLKLRWV